MKKLFNHYLSGFILFVISIALLVLTGWVGLAYTILTFLFRVRILGLLKGLNKLFLRMAVSIDQLGNVLMQELFNAILIKKESLDKFGSEDETISSVIGKNQKRGMLTGAGNALNWVLNKIDPGHSLNSIETGKRIGMNV
jgi:8-oxo-dGTP diphosphatase